MDWKSNFWFSIHGFNLHPIILGDLHRLRSIIVNCCPFNFISFTTTSTSNPVTASDSLYWIYSIHLILRSHVQHKAAAAAHMRRERESLYRALTSLSLSISSSIVLWLHDRLVFAYFLFQLLLFLLFLLLFHFYGQQHNRWLFYPQLKRVQN